MFAVTAWEAGSKCVDYYMTWRAHPVRTLPLPFNLRGTCLRRRHAQRAHQTPGMCIRGARRSFISSRGALISPAELEKKIDRFDTDFRRLARVLDREFKRVSCVSRSIPVLYAVLTGVYAPGRRRRSPRRQRQRAARRPRRPACRRAGRTCPPALRYRRLTTRRVNLVRPRSRALLSFMSADRETPAQTQDASLPDPPP